VTLAIRDVVPVTVQPELLPSGYGDRRVLQLPLYIADVEPVKGASVIETSWRGQSILLAARQSDGSLKSGVDWNRLGRLYLSENRSQGSFKPLQAKLPFNYSRLPQWVRHLAYRVLGAMHKPGDYRLFPDFSGAAETLLCFYWHSLATAGDAATPPVIWPHGKRWAFSATHDVDHPFLLLQTKWIDALRALHREFDIRATWFVDIRALNDAAARRMLQALQKDGHEIAAHGFAHDARIGRGEGEEWDIFLKNYDGFQKAFGSVGFRAPCMARSPKLRQVLSAQFKYDSSTPDADIRSNNPSMNGGCAYPFPFHANGIMELPVTLPDESYRAELRLSVSDYFNRLRIKTDRLASWGAHAISVQHPVIYFGASDAMFDAYRRFLQDQVRRTDVWIAPLRDIASHVPTAALPHAIEQEPGK
jgi:peptidoglycan/xylan/chitin deacetylase (PgdA/CDA1 family)